MDVVIMILMFIIGGLITAQIGLIYFLIQTKKELAQFDIDIEQILYLIDEQEKVMAANTLEMDKVRESIRSV